MKPEIYKRIYVLGSGFSKSMSKKMPAMRELTTKLKKHNNRKYPELMRFISQLEEQSNNSPELMSVESITSLILGRRLFYNNDNYLHFQILRNQLLHWLHENIHSAAHDVDEDKEELLIKFIRKCATPDEHGHKSLVITFNYDLLIESLFKRRLFDDVELDYMIKLNSYFGKEIHPDPGKNLFRYIKLHGSFNWFRSPGSNECNVDNVYRSDFDDVSRDLIHHGDIPVFIPMAFTKQNFFEGSFYNVIWNIAIRYLEMAEEINFIGYGFPATDRDNLAMFLNYKDKIKDIVTRGDRGARDARLISLFGKEKMCKMDAAKYIELL